MKENKPISKVFDIPIIGWALKATPVGIPWWIASKILGYGKKHRKIKGGKNTTKKRRHIKRR